MDNVCNVDSIRVLLGLPDLKTVSSELLDEQWDVIYVSELHFVDTRQGGKAEERKKREEKEARRCKVFSSLKLNGNHSFFGRCQPMWKWGIHQDRLLLTQLNR